MILREYPFNNELLEAGRRRSVHLDLTTVSHLGRACHQAVENWVEQRRKQDCAVEVEMPARKRGTSAPVPMT